ncbi:MAG: MarR family transcriptional regulator [Anaerolineae bacterium]|nr:MarR family transcriptional regulator [Anaerolineae bacterium]
MTKAKRGDPETFALAERLLGVFLRLTQITKDETPDDMVAQLNVNQLRALNLIYHEPGISQKALADRLGVTSASVSVSIGKMLEADLVERHHDSEDGRIQRLYLGASGRELVRRAEDVQVQVIAELLDGLPLDEQRLVVQLLERALMIREDLPDSLAILSG